LTLFGTAIYTGRRLRPAAAAVVEQPAAWTAASV
jgi:hypothetical protein